MRKIISYPLSAIYYVLFGFTLVFFHALQWFCFHLFGYKAHKKSVDYMCFFLVANTYLLGTRYKFEHRNKIPQGVPLIIAANHQSFYDIPAIAWFLNKYHIKFVSKIELGKGVPGISYNLRHGGSVLINRKDPRQAIREITKLGKYIEENQRAAVIFPEGTRSKTGQPKAFSASGLKVLCKNAPSAYIVPVTINNTWKMTRWGVFPMGLGNRLVFTVQDPFPVAETSFDELVRRTEESVVKDIKY